MKTRLLLLTVAFAAAASLPLRAVDTPATEAWVVTSAKATGSGGEQFVTSLRIVNPGTATATVTLKILPQTPLDAGGNALSDNTGSAAVTVTVPAGQTLAIEDVLGSKFSATGAAGLRVTSDLPVVVMSQTLVANARSATGAAGTYGFAIPAQGDDNALGVGETAYVPYVSGAPDGATSGYRTNLFLLSANASGNTTLHVKLVRADGSVVGERDFQLGKLSQTQVNRIASSFGSQATDTGMTAIVTVKSGGPIFLGASVIDNATSSILYTPPVKTWRAQNAAYGLNIDPSGGYGFSGRLDVTNGVPDFLSAGLVLECSSGAFLFFMQAASSGAVSQSQSFHVSQTGPDSFTFSGAAMNTDGSQSATYTGTIAFAPDGSVSGQIAYTRVNAAGNACAGTTKTFPFYGTKFADLGP